MPRDANGNYSAPPGTTVNSGDTILVSQHNPFVNDVSQAVSNSLDRNGSGGMRANLPMNGSRVTGLADGALPDDAATVAQAGSLGVPIGAILDWPAAVAPANYMLSFGQAISRTTYATLFALIGTTFGAGDGTTTFQVPDYRGNGSAGLDNMGGISAGRLAGATSIGAILGAQTVVLTSAQMPEHNHGGVTGAAGAHAHNQPSFLNNPSGFQQGAPVQTGTLGAGFPTTTVGDHSHTIPTSGSGFAHPNVQPTIAMNKIIRVL